MHEQTLIVGSRREVAGQRRYARGGVRYAGPQPPRRVGARRAGIRTVGATTAITVAALLGCSGHGGRTSADQVGGRGAAAAADRGPVRPGAGWHLDSIDLDVVLAADGRGFDVGGTLHLRSPAEGSAVMALVVAPGAMRFVDVAASGASAEVSASGDTTRLRFTNAVRGASTVAVSFRATTRVSRGGRRFAALPDGAFAFSDGNWHPRPLARGEGGGVAAPGTLRLTIPARWRSMSNGVLADSSLAAGARTEIWTSARPVAWSFIAAPAVVRRDHGGGVGIVVHLLPIEAARAQAIAEAIPPILDVLSGAYGAPAFETIGIAAMPAAIAPPGFVDRAEHGYVAVHESALARDPFDVALLARALARLWWPEGDDARSPGDAVVSEALAAYAAALVVEARSGAAAMTRYLRDGTPESARGFFHLWRTGGDEPLGRDAAPRVARTKGPWMLHMLRQRVGDSLFFGVMRRLSAERTGGRIAAGELRKAFTSAAPSETDLPRYFADWLDRAGAPVLDLRWRDAGTEEAPRVAIEIRQRTAPYRFPLELEIRTARGSSRPIVEVSDSAHRFVIETHATPIEVRLDPDHQLLLWEPAFGPLPRVTPAFSDAEMRGWIDAEIAWLTRVHGASATAVAILARHDIAWYGAYLATGARRTPLGAHALFQVGELSEIVTALTALSLWREGTLALDTDVNQYLRTWRTPQAPTGGGEPVTIRRLLRHESGLTRDFFPSVRADSARPTLADLLRGGSASPWEPVAFDTTPGTAFARTFADYAVLQQVIEDVTGRPLEHVARQRVLVPLGLSRTTFAQPLSSSRRREAIASRLGRLDPDDPRWRVYPAQGAAGLWSTAADMGSLVVAVLRVARGADGALDSAIVAALLEPGRHTQLTALGRGQNAAGVWYVPADSGQREAIVAGGSTRGFTALALGFVDSGDGAVILTDAGWMGHDLTIEVAQRLAIVGRWTRLPTR